MRAVATTGPGRLEIVDVAPPRVGMVLVCLERAGICGMEARAIKSPDEIKAFSMVGAICDFVHYEIANFIKPGMTENQVAAFGFERLYSIPGMEDVEDVIVSSGPNAWPNWRNFSDRMIRPGELVIIDLAAFTWNGFKSCVYRTYCVGESPPTRCSASTTRRTNGCGIRSKPPARV